MDYALMLLGLWVATPKDVPARYYQLRTIWLGSLVGAAGVLIVLPILGISLTPAP